MDLVVFVCVFDCGGGLRVDGQWCLRNRMCDVATCLRNWMCDVAACACIQIANICFSYRIDMLSICCICFLIQANVVPRYFSPSRRSFRGNFPSAHSSVISHR